MSPPADPLRLVLDASVFTNPDSGKAWGGGAAAAVEAFVAQAGALAARVHCFMPPAVFEELKTFIPGEQVPPDFEAVVHLKSPNRFRADVPGFLLYELIDDMRRRIDRGLRVAERAVRNAAPANVDKTIAKLREQYRTALRSGLLDSKEDVDLILLSKELEAALVSSDRGVVTWAEKLGLRLVHPANLRELLEKLAAGGSP